MMEARPVLVGLGQSPRRDPGMRTTCCCTPARHHWTGCRTDEGRRHRALIFEGKAKDDVEAQALVKAGKVDFEPCHHHQAVGPMAGIICPRCQCMS